MSLKGEIMDINNLWSGYDLNSKKQNTRCLAVNTILEGKYLVGPVLGQGGFGITYVGYDLNMEAKIAIKEYFPVELVSRDTTTMHGDRVLSLSGEKSVTYKAGLKKYVAEAQNVSQFSEIPGVVSVKDFFYANETAYIVMEFIDGISLKDYLKEKGGRLSEEETLKIMKPVLEALVQIHKSGIIHRDISPDNIMLTFKDGDAHNQIESVKLIDFGAARMTEKNDQKSLTIILKHGYAPEEQYRTHGEQGPWTDVYALCAVLYRMLTGETPIPAMDRMFKDELKTIEQCGAKVSVNTATAILKGLAVKKDERIQSVQELMEALYEGAKVQTVIKKQQKKTVFITGAIVVVAVCVIGFIALSGKKDKTVLNHPEFLEMESKTQAEEKNNEETAEISLDLKKQQDVLGEQIVSYHPQNSITYTKGGRHILICKPDGTVVARGSNSVGQCNVEEWDNIVSVKASNVHSLGLKSDGTVVAAGSNNRGQCDVTHWSDVVQICAGSGFSLGVTSEGKVLVAGTLTYGDNAEELLKEVQGWENIKCLTSEIYTAIAGLTKDGTLMIAGTDVQEKLDGWEKAENIWFSGANIIGMDVEGNVYKASLLSQEDAEQMLAGYRASSAEKYAAYPFESLPTMRQIRIPFADGVDKDGNLLEQIVHPEPTSTLTDTDYPEEIEGWEDLLAVSYSYNSNVAYGLQKDGTILEYLDNNGNAEIEDFKNLEWIQLFGDGANERFGLIGRTKDHEILYYGVAHADQYPGKEGDYGQKIISATEYTCLLEDGTLIDNLWEVDFPTSKVKQVVEIEQVWWWLLMEDGTVKSTLQTGYGTEERFEGAKQKASQWTDIVQIAGVYDALYGLKEDGTVVSTLDEAPVLENVKQIVYFGGRWAALKNDGTVEPMWYGGDDASGAYMAEQWTGIDRIELGETHIVGLKPDGTVVAAGSNHCGQCDVEEWKDVVMVDAGINCTVGLTKDGELLVAGRLQ